MSQEICKLLVSGMLAGSIAGFSFGQETPVKNTAVTAPATPSGAELYNQHCAVCHGGDLKGTGPVPDPYRPPPDLTTLTRRYGGKFPAAYVSRVLRSGATLPAHGPAEMPVWGTEFAAAAPSGKTQVALRITNLINYIKSLQEK